MLSLKEYTLRVTTTICILGSMILVPYFIYKIFPALIPIMLAYLTALSLDQVALSIQKRLHMRRSATVTFSYLSYIGLLLFLVYLLFHKLLSELIAISNYIKNNIQDIQRSIFSFMDSLENVLRLLPHDSVQSLNQMAATLLVQISDMNIIEKISDYTGNISSFLLGLMIYFIATFMLIFRLDRIHQMFYSFLKPKTAQAVHMVTIELRNAAIGYCKAQIMLSIIPFVISLIGLTILGAKYILLLSLVIAIIDTLPIIGAGAIFVPWALINFLQGNYIFGLRLLILYLAITIVRKAAEPKVLGSSVGIGALATLISMWIGFKVWGIMGVMFLPFICIFFNILVKTGLIRWTVKI